MSNTAEKVEQQQGNGIRPNWRYVQGAVSDSRYHRVYRDDVLGVQMEIITRRRDGMPVGKGRAYFFMDGNDYEFKTEDELMRRWSAREENRESNRKANSSSSSTVTST